MFKINLNEFVMYLQKSHHKHAQPCNGAPCEGSDHGKHVRAGRVADRLLS